MSANISVLIAEDSEDDAALVLRELKKGGYVVNHKRVDTRDEYTSLLLNEDWDVIIADFTMPKFNGMTALHILKESSKDIPFILVSGTVGEEVAVEAMRAGAQDYILKSKLTRLALAVKREISQAHIRKKRKEVEKELHESEERLVRIIDTIIEGIYVLDTNGKIIFANKTAEKIFGLPRQDIYGWAYNDERWKFRKTTADPFRDEDHPFAIVKNSGKPVFGLEVIYDHPSGKSMMLSINASPLRDSSGSFSGVVATQNDITERKFMEAQLAQANKLESIGQLAAGIAHEINTPIQYIGDNTRFLREAFGEITTLLSEYSVCRAGVKNGSLPPAGLIDRISAMESKIDVEYLCAEIPKALAQSLEGVGRVAAIVRAMKQYSHPGTAEKVPIDIPTSIDSAITISKNEWKYVAEVVANYDPNMPQALLPPGEFNQAILNLIVNAAHAIEEMGYGTENKGKGRIQISARRVNDDIEIKVSDNGAGIPEKSRPKIFEPFFTTKEIGKGTGQGLAIARSIIVKKMGGSVVFETEVGKGTTFIVTFPISGQVNEGVLKDGGLAPVAH